jgi:glycosyltransferase involved in cell wall biosynthesis
MRCLIITQHYAPEPNFITQDLAEGLASKATCTVITTHPNYPYGQFYQGVDGLRIQKSIENQVTIWRLPMYPDHSRSVLRRGLSYLSFTLLAFVMAPFLMWKPDKVIVYQTPFCVGLSALFFKYLYRSKIIFVSADLWPESFSASGIHLPRIVENFLYFYSRWINRRADLVFATTKGMMARFVGDGLDPKKLVYAPLWVDGSVDDIQQADQGSTTENPAQDVVRCVYVGNFGAAQDLGTVLCAAELLKVSHPKIKFDLYGAGVEEPQLQALKNELKLENLEFHGRIDSKKAFMVSAAADVQLVHLKSSPLFLMTVPSKLAFCLSAGSPIVAGVIGESAEILRECGGAQVVAPQSPKEMAEAIVKVTKLSNDDRKQIKLIMRSYYDQYFNKKTLLDRYLQGILSD